MYTKIMVPYDCSDHAKKALEHAKGLLETEKDATLHVVTAVPAGVFDVSGSPDGMAFGMLSRDQYEAIVNNVITEAEAKVRESVGDSLDDIADRVTIEAVAGASVISALVNYVDTHDVDLIVMGRRGLGAVRGMIGSVSIGLLRETDVPVLTIK